MYDPLSNVRSWKVLCSVAMLMVVASEGPVPVLRNVLPVYETHRFFGTHRTVEIFIVTHVSSGS